MEQVFVVDGYTDGKDVALQEGILYASKILRGGHSTFQQVEAASLRLWK